MNYLTQKGFTINEELKSINDKRFTLNEWLVLEILSRRQGQLARRTDIMQEMYGDKLMMSNVLDVHVKNLRKKLPKGIKVETVRQYGFRLDINAN